MNTIKTVILPFLLLIGIASQAQNNAPKTIMRSIKVTVKKLNDNMIVMVPDSQPNQRYLASQLPEVLQRDGLHLMIDGEVGQIPPNVRMIGTPFRMTSITISRADKKRYKLPKSKWIIKN